MFSYVRRTWTNCLQGGLAQQQHEYVHTSHHTPNTLLRIALAGNEKV